MADHFEDILEMVEIGSCAKRELPDLPLTDNDFLQNHTPVMRSVRSRSNARFVRILKPCVAARTHATQ